MATAIAVDPSNNVYVTGYSYSRSNFNDFATIAYSGVGVALWTNRYNGPGNGDDRGLAVVTDQNGIVYVAGVSYGGASSNDYAVIAYSSAGTALWTNRCTGGANGDDSPSRRSCLGVGPDGSVYVTGASDGDYSPNTAYDYLTVKYQPAPSIWLSGPNTLGDSSFRFTINATSNTIFRVEGSTDLVGWLTLTNHIRIQDTSVNYTDRVAGSFPRRIYRAVWEP